MPNARPGEVFGPIRRARGVAWTALQCLAACVGLARPLLCQASPPGCDATRLLSRSDVRQGIAQLYDEARADDREHVMLVYSDSVDVHPNALIGRRTIRFGVPVETVATFHVHPLGTLAGPSDQDVEGVKRLQLGRPGVCSYVVGTDARGVRTTYEILQDGTTVLARPPG
jgi:hypothetical protein